VTGAAGRNPVEQLREAFPSAPVIGLADDRHQPEVDRGLRAGARLCILKSASAEVLMAAMLLAESDAICLPTPAPESDEGVGLHSDIRPLRKVPSPTPADLGLTPKQSRVLNLLLQGKSAKGIARELGLCTGTVKTHTTAVLRALNVNTRVQAVLAARRMGLQLDVCH
jgi:DNA-binding NarL/FixJ family response regulator